MSTFRTVSGCASTGEVDSRVATITPTTNKLEAIASANPDAPTSARLVSSGQLARVIVSYVEARPERMQEGMEVLTIDAIRGLALREPGPTMGGW